MAQQTVILKLTARLASLRCWFSVLNHSYSMGRRPTRRRRCASRASKARAGKGRTGQPGSVGAGALPSRHPQYTPMAYHFFLSSFRGTTAAPTQSVSMPRSPVKSTDSLLLPGPPPFLAVLPAAGRLRPVLPLAADLAVLCGPRLSRRPASLPCDAPCSGGGMRLRLPLDSSVRCSGDSRNRR